MNHKLIILLVSLIINGLCKAQTIDNDVLPSDRNHWTVTVAYDVSIPGKWKLANGSFKMFKPGSGISIGADYMMLIGNNVFFEPGARFFIDNYSYENITIVTIGNGTLEEPSKTYDPPVRKIGFRIPLTVGYKFDIFKKGSLILSTGPEHIIGLAAR
ncbi:MAG: hypothetical protein K2G78_08630, partial [Muribaculaceae bacterium]|nr:hypothetical protein [Muribaculaceae bacterium]